MAARNVGKHNDLFDLKASSLPGKQNVFTPCDVDSWWKLNIIDWDT